MGPIETRIRARLEQALQPLHLELRNESHMHAGPAAESHWNLVVASAAFDGLPAVRRQRLVYGALAAELADGLHALTMRTLSPDEWQAATGPLAPVSPPCLGGSAADK